MLNASSSFSSKEPQPTQRSDPKSFTQQESQRAVGTKEQAWQTFLPVSLLEWDLSMAGHSDSPPVLPHADVSRHDAPSDFV